MVKRMSFPAPNRCPHHPLRMPGNLPRCSCPYPELVGAFLLTVLFPLIPPPVGLTPQLKTSPIEFGICLPIALVEGAVCGFLVGWLARETEAKLNRMPPARVSGRWR